MRQFNRVVDVGRCRYVFAALGPVFLGGDVHTTYVCDVKADFDAVFLGMGLGDTNALEGAESLDGVQEAVEYIAMLRQAPDMTVGPGLATYTAPSPTQYDFTLNSIDGKATPLASYKGKVLLLVNVADPVAVVREAARIVRVNRVISKSPSFKLRER